MKISDMTKRISCIVLTVIFIALSCFIYAADTFAPNADGFYEISTREELLLFSNLVNGVGDYVGKADPSANGILTADIVYNTGVLTATGNLNTAGTYDAWMPIGYFVSNEESTVYGGTFNGNGHTVSGIFVNSSSLEGIGFFGYTSADAKISNLTVTASYIEGTDCVGAIVGNNLGSIDNCHSKGNVILADKAENGGGGIVGYSDGPISSCTNTSTVFVSSVEVDNHFTGRAGGICGLGTVKAEIKSCLNEGEITCVGFSAGGIAGTCGNIQDCLNTGEITGTSEVGGIIGKVSYLMKNCFSNCTIYYTSSGYGIGALAGLSDIDSGKFALYIENNYYKNLSLAGVGGTLNTFGTVCPYTDYPTCTQAVKNAQISSGEVAFLLGEGFGQIIGTETKFHLAAADKSDAVYKINIATNGELGTVSAVTDGIYTNRVLTANITVEGAYFCGWKLDRRMVCSTTDYMLSPSDNLKTVTAVFTTVIGDVNGDGEVNAQDLVIIKQHVQGYLSVNETVADINADGTVDMNDVLAISNLLV